MVNKSDSKQTSYSTCRHQYIKEDQKTIIIGQKLLLTYLYNILNIVQKPRRSQLLEHNHLDVYVLTIPWGFNLIFNFLTNF